MFKSVLKIFAIIMTLVIAGILAKESLGLMSEKGYAAPISGMVMLFWTIIGVAFVLLKTIKSFIK